MLPAKIKSNSLQMWAFPSVAMVTDILNCPIVYNLNDHMHIREDLIGTFKFLIVSRCLYSVPLTTLQKSGNML